MYTVVGPFFASIWPDTVVVAHYFEQIFAYFQRNFLRFWKGNDDFVTKIVGSKVGI